MSQRLGMADGRCFTVSNSSKLFDNYVMEKNGISYEDNYKYRQLVQKQGPAAFKKVLNETNDKCGYCDSNINMSKIY